MIGPEDIKRKAERAYPAFLQAWMRGEDDYFPLTIRGNKKPDSVDPAEVIESIRRLREGSKEVRGFGYSVEWEERRSRKFGRNKFPVRLFFETRDDYLRFVGKRKEFAAFEAAVTQLRTEFAPLETWLLRNTARLAGRVRDLEGLLAVARFFREHPRPDRFARELPIAVDTKFIERHEAILGEWFDLILPPHTIRADETHFARRYGLRYAERHLLVRLLDGALEEELGFPCAELSLPLEMLGELPGRVRRVFVVENKVNLLTLPPVEGSLALGALGRAVTDLRYVPWLADAELHYWGDLDVQGFEILASLRSIYPHARSLMMDIETLEPFEHLAGKGTGHRPEPPALLTQGELAAFERCRAENIRLEQERIPQAEVERSFDESFDELRESR